MSVSQLDNVISVVIENLLSENKNNEEYWDKINSDKTHIFHSQQDFISRKLGRGGETGADENNPAVNCGRNGIYPLSEAIQEKYMFLFTTELKSEVIEYLRKIKNFSGLNLAVCIRDKKHGSDSQEILDDLLTRDSLIFSAITELLKISIVIYRGSRSPYTFEPNTHMLKTGTPVVLQWDKSSRKFVISDLTSMKESKFALDAPGPSGEQFNRVEEKILKHKSDSPEKKRSKRAKICMDRSARDHHFTDSDSDDVRNDLYLSDSGSNSESGSNADDSDEGLDFHKEIKKLSKSAKKGHKAPIIEMSDESKSLMHTPMSGTLAQNKRDTACKHLDQVVDISEKLKSHSEMIKKNLLSCYDSDCKFCPVHCIPALHKATRGKEARKNLVLVVAVKIRLNDTELYSLLIKKRVSLVKFAKISYHLSHYITSILNENILNLIL